MVILQLIVLLCLGYICYQDMKYRAVYWILFPVLSIVLFYLKYQYTGWAGTLMDTGCALGFFGLQLFLLWLYFSIKHRKLTNITTQYLGLGDVLFLVSIAFYLSPINYVLFYVSSLILVLGYALTVQNIKSVKDKSIPLAGLQAALLCVLLVIAYLLPQMRLYDDNWIYHI